MKIPLFFITSVFFVIGAYMYVITFFLTTYKPHVYSQINCQQITVVNNPSVTLRQGTQPCQLFT